MNADGSDPVRLTNELGEDANPYWLPAAPAGQALTPVPTVTAAQTPNVAPQLVPPNLVPFAPENWDAPLVLSAERAVFLEIPPPVAGPTSPTSRCSSTGPSRTSPSSR